MVHKMLHFYYFVTDPEEALHCYLDYRWMDGWMDGCTRAESEGIDRKVLSGQSVMQRVEKYQ